MVVFAPVCVIGEEKDAAKEVAAQARLAEKQAKEEAKKAARLAKDRAKKEAKMVSAEARWEENQRKWKNALNLSCPDGGEDEVVISKRLGHDAFRVQGNQAKQFIFAQYMGLVEIVNPYGERIKGVNVGPFAPAHLMLDRTMCTSARFL